VDVDGGKDLVPVTIWEAQNDSIFGIANNMNDMVLRSKKNQNREHTEVTKIFSLLPTYILGLLTAACSYLALNAGIGVKPLNVSCST
jgi:hypothetical protein